MNHRKVVKKTAEIFSRKISSVLFAVCFLHACTNVGQVKNQELVNFEQEPRYSVDTWRDANKDRELSIFLSFSGGGTRAAALAYGVMQEMKKTSIVIDGETRSILDQVRAISSVSGGSFTAAYYGLNGDGIFETFEKDFLRADLDKPLALQLINPATWATKTSRTDKAVEIYEKRIFHNATFADMLKPDGPMIIINATDLTVGTRFSFIQDYFDLLCSDLPSFSVARAVTASSAVPILFEPVVVENFSGCGSGALIEKLEALPDDQEGAMATLVDRLASYEDKEKRKFIHFMDGGLVDNLGLRALTDVVALSGGAGEFFRNNLYQPPRRFVVIEVNAATASHKDLDQSADEPHITEVISALTNMHINKGDAASVQSTKDLINNWSQKISTPEHPTSGYFIQVGLASEEAKMHFVTENLPQNVVNSIPTSFSLKDDEVDLLIKEGGDLLRTNPVFQQLLSELSDP